MEGKQRYSKVKNKILKDKILKAKYVIYNDKKHLTINDLGYKSIYQISDLSLKRWKSYFGSGGKIYIDKASLRVFIPSQYSILFDKEGKVLLSKGSKKPSQANKLKRVYEKNNLNRKAGGLNIYLQKNDKFTKNDRTRFIILTENYISEFNSKMNNLNQVNHIDSSLSDLENLEIWNNFYIKHGAQIPELRGRWENQYLNNTTDDNSNDSFDKEKLEAFRMKYKRGYPDLGF